MASAGVFEAFWLLAAGHVAWGVGWTMQSGADVAWLTDELRDPGRVGRLVVTRSKVQVAAHAAGVPTTLLLNLFMTRSGAIVVSSMSLFVWGLILFVVMPETGFTRHRGQGLGELRQVLLHSVRVAAALFAAAGLFAGRAERGGAVPA